MLVEQEPGQSRGSAEALVARLGRLLRAARVAAKAAEEAERAALAEYYRTPYADA
jgi:hypothetical protein